MFEKGNTLWKKGLAVKKERQDKIEEFFVVSQLGGRYRYVEMLDKLSNGEELTKPEIEFMDRYEKLWPYTKAKMASVEHSGKDGGDLIFKLINYGNDSA